MLDKRFALDFGNVHVQYVVLIPLFGILGTLLFYFIDRYWYHRLLLGSVEHAGEIEKKYAKDLPELSLGKAISDKSPYKPRLVVTFLARLVVWDKKFKETGKLHSDGKIELFYKSVAVLLLITSVLLATTGGVFRKGPNEITAPAEEPTGQRGP